MSGVSIATGVIATDALGGGTGRGLQSPGVLAQSGASTSVTGTVSKTALATITIPGGMLGANGIIRIIPLFSYTNSANNKTLSTELNGTAVVSAVVTTTADDQFIIIYRAANSTTAQKYYVGGTGIGPIASAIGTAAINTANDVILTISGTLANTGETITLEAYTVEILNP